MTLVSLPLIAAGGLHAGESPGSAVNDAQRSRCDEVLLAALKDASPWVRVHAAEALTALKRPEPALAAFRPIAHTSEPKYRVVVWRVLAAAESEAGRRREYVERIRQAFLSTNGPDRTHASEALAKLGEPAADDVERRMIEEVAKAAGPESPFALWRIAQSGDATAVDRLAKLLQADDVTTRARAAYVLGRLRPSSRNVADAFSAALAKEPADSPARAMIRAATGADSARVLASDEIVPPSGRYFAAMTLAETGTAGDQTLLAKLLDDPDSDVRVGAAYAILRIHGRTTAVTRPTASH